MAATREAQVQWNGDLISGSGSVDASTSRAFTSLPVTWGSRTESAEGRTSPEELVAAAHASCYAMALSFGLGQSGKPPEALHVGAKMTIDNVDGGWKVVSSKLTVRGRVPGISESDFRAAAETAKDGCPISQALKGNVALSVEATLEG
jgi:osmotically inducible protein OsmC